MRETYLIPIDDPGDGDEKILIYRPLLGLAFVGNRAMADLALKTANATEPLPAPADEATRFLAENGFFLPDRNVCHPTNELNTAVLLLTNRCQLRCIYCYAAAGAHQEKVLDFHSAKAVIDYVFQQTVEHGKKDFKVEIHGGGEPTLEWDLTRQVVEYTRGLPLPARITITSNAIWSEAQCEWLIRNVDGISVSMDGGEETQNHNRPLQSGKPSAAIVSRNLRLLDDHGYAYGIRMTAVEPWDDLAENIRYLAENTKCRNVQVEPAFRYGRGFHGSPDQEECQQFVEAFQAAYLVGQEYQLDLRYSSARAGVITDRFCSAPYNGLVVNPQDQIVACYEVVNQQHELEEPSVLGEVKAGQVILYPGRREHLHQLLAERLDHCSSCFCKWSCAGDCYVRTFKPELQGHLVFGHRCYINRELTTFLLLHLISKSGGVWRSFRMITNPQAVKHG